mgnify:CR=1 FL=1
MNLSDLEKGYLAGFIDGEGSLIINKRNHVGHKGKRYTGYSAYIDIGNTNLEVLEWIKQRVNLKAKIYKNQGKGNRKLAYRIRIGWRLSCELIKTLQPLLVVKREIANVFLEYENNPDKENVWQRAKLLNKRGL